MSKELKLKPALRFPEFKNEGKWDAKELNELGELINGLTYSPDDVRDKGLLVLRSSNIQNGRIELNDCVYVREDIKGANLTEPKDILVCVRNGSKNLIGKNAIIPKGLPLVTHGAFMTVFRAINPEFVFQLFQTDYYDTQVKADLGATINSINGKNFLKYEFPVPENPDEQQKIASCLSSLDEVIAAHSQKLDLLKNKKIGLMQNLFPQGGEKVPKYRFKEFEQDGVWVEQSIQKLINEKAIVSHLDGNHGSLYPKAEEFSQDGIPYITANDFISGVINFSKCKYLPIQKAKQFKKGVAKNGDILFAHNATVGPVAKLVTSFPYVILSTTATYYRCNNVNLINDFLLFSLASPFFIRQYTRVMSQSTRNQVPITAQREFILHLPEPREQQKIAECLSSLDSLITAQAKKIEQLKIHKKGLMQGLFPKIID